MKYPKKDRCSKCTFRAPENSPWQCDYISITGQSRGCTPDAKCKRFEEGDRKPCIMDEWRIPKVTEDADIYVRTRYRRHLQYLLEKSKQ